MTNREKYFNQNRGRDLRRTTGRSKTWIASELWDLHHEIIRLKVLGFKNVTISEMLGCTPQTVSNTINSPIARERINELSSVRDVKTMDIRKEVEDCAPEAFLLLRDVIRGNGAGEGANIALRARTAENMLDRTVPRKTDHRHLHGHFTPDQIAEFKQRAQGNIVEERERKRAS